MHDVSNSRNVFIVRHCQPQFHERTGICLGKKDISLSVNGRMGAKVLADYLSDKMINHVFSSPLKRAQETTLIITDDRFNIRNDFSELDMGIWDGLSFDEIRQKYPKEYEERGNDLENYIVQGGESMRMCKLRTMRELHRTINETDGNLLIVTHAGVIRTIISSVAKISIKETFEYKIGYGSITLININNNKLNLIKIGDLNYKDIL